MAAPEFVIASDAYNVYPGGIIVFKAAEWLAGARGTLSTETDARSCAGTVVRDAQKVTAEIEYYNYLGDNFAWNEADDTLVIDLADVPEAEAGLRYIVLASILIEGDWDPTDVSQTKTAHQERHEGACRLAFHATDNDEFPEADAFSSPNFQPRGLDSYRIIGYGGNWVLDELDPTTVLTWKAYSKDTSTIEYLIDQIYLVPAHFQPGSGGGADNQWKTGDFNIVPGSHSTFGIYDLDDGSYVDGADGGDDNGKFTWHPSIFDEPTDISGGDGGGDYQKDDNEYMVRVVGDDGTGDGDFYYLARTGQPFGSEEPPASHCYGLHGPFYVPAQVWVDDDFSRTLGDNDFSGADDHFLDVNNWGLGPQGFFWKYLTAGPFGPQTDPVSLNRWGTAVWVDGSRGSCQVQTAAFEGGGGLAIGLESGLDGAGIFADNLLFSGTVLWEVSAALRPITHNEGASIVISTGPTGSYQNRIEIRFDFDTAVWSIYAADDEIVGPLTLASWNNLTDSFKFRIEVRRHLLRVKLWRASDTEPGTWDYDDFRPLRRSFVVKDYPYDDDLNFSIQEADAHVPNFSLSIRKETPDFGRISIDDVVVEYDPYGDNESASASIEQPEGNEIGRIEMPAGCQHLVYWGKRDWTEYISGDGPYLDFSAKTWNDPAAAELQRSEAVWWWFRSVHGGGGIVSMNWRSSERAGQARRVLVGG